MVTTRTIVNPFTAELQKTYDDTEVSGDVSANETNIVLNAFRIAVNGTLTKFNMLDSIVDYYNDESGIDTVDSEREVYDSSGKFYRPETELTEDVKLLLHLNGTDGQKTTTDDSPSAHAITFNGDAELDTVIKKFGSASCLFDGNGDYLSTPDSTDWDIFENLVDDWTVDFWVYGSFSGTMHMLTQVQDGSNYWNISRENANPLFCTMYNSGALKINMFYNGVMASGVWHHVAFVKVGDDCGLYLNGTQVAYDVHDTPTTLSAALTTSSFGGSPSYLNGNMDEIRILKTNIFNASPNVGKTDTIVVPTSEYNPVSITYNMTLISEDFTAEAQADEGRLIILEEDVDSITLNTDLLAYISRDNGTTWTQAVLVDDGDFNDNKKILTALADISSQPAGTDMRYKLETANNKNLRIHATSELWG